MAAKKAADDSPAYASLLPKIGELPDFRAALREFARDVMREMTPPGGNVAVMSQGAVPTPTPAYAIPQARDIVHAAFKNLADTYQKYRQAHDQLQSVSPTQPDYMSFADRAMQSTMDYLGAAENYTATLGQINGRA